MDPDNSNESGRLIDQQITQNNIEIEQKREAITQERLGIIKSQGGQNWSPSPSPALGAQHAVDKQKALEDKFKSDHGVRSGY